MNDPNGMFYLMEIIIYFINITLDNVWGPMHWAHAISKDLIHWENKPMRFILMEITIFSLDQLVDKNNKSGLGDGNNPPILAFYKS